MPSLAAQLLTPPVPATQLSTVAGDAAPARQTDVSSSPQPRALQVVSPFGILTSIAMFVPRLYDSQLLVVNHTLTFSHRDQANGNEIVD